MVNAEVFRFVLFFNWFFFLYNRGFAAKRELILVILI